MPIARESGTDFVPAPEGTHVARCIWVISLGTQPSGNPAFDPSFKVLVGWELPEEEIKYNGELKPMIVTKEYTLSLSEKATLRKDLESWRARQFTKEEAKGFDVGKVVGVPCLLTVTHQVSGKGRRYAKVSAVSAITKGMQVKPQVHRSMIYEMGDGNNEIFELLPAWIQKKISQAAETVSPPPTHTEPEPEMVEDESEIPF